MISTNAATGGADDADRPEFWTLQGPLGDGYMTVDYVGLPTEAGLLTDEIDFDVGERVAAGDLGRATGPPVFKPVGRSRRTGTLIRSTGAHKLISDAAAAVLKDIGATGWVTYPVEVRLGKGDVLSGYQGIASTGACGWLRHPLATGLNAEGVEVAIGLDVIASGWDGSDIFSPHARPMPTLKVAPRVLHALRDAGLDDFEATAVSTEVVPLEYLEP